MALRDQPYLPLYVRDFLTDEKLNMCSPASQGIYIKIMCLFHKSDPYGGILLKQKDKQDESICFSFAYKLTRLLPFDLKQIYDAITELLDEKVLFIDGDFLYQKRMVNDNKISILRSEIGKKGGKKTQNKNKEFAKAKSKANSEYESDIENGVVISSILNIEFETFWREYDKKVGDKSKLEKKWTSLSNLERELIIDHIPLYKLSQPDKKFRKDPSTYLNNKSWNDEIIISNGGRQQQRSVSERAGEIDGIVDAVFAAKGLK